MCKLECSNVPNNEEDVFLPDRLMPYELPSYMESVLQYMPNHDQRRTTDKYWSYLFVVIFTSWILSWQYAMSHHQADENLLFDNCSIKSINNAVRSGFDTDTKNTCVDLECGRNFSWVADNNTAAMNISRFVHNKTIRKTNSSHNNTLAEKVKEHLSLDLSELLCNLLDIFTCNPSHLDAKIKKFKSAVLAILVYVYVCVLYLMYSFETMRKDKKFCVQPFNIGAAFLFITLVEHLSIIYHLDESFLPSHEKLAYWVVPETLFLIIWLWKMISAFHYTASEEDDTCPTIPLLNQMFTIVVGVPVYIIIKFLITSTSSILRILAWNSAFFYIIAIGSSYVGLTMYYCGMMVISCAHRVTSETSQPFLTSLFHAILIFTRYHFGTACYHATLIFPRFHATIIMFDSRLRALSRHSIMERFYVTHWHAHSISKALTGILGTNYSESLRLVLRLITTNTIKMEDNYNYGAICRSLLTFLLSTNSLIIILFWVIGKDDPHFSLATWVMYIKIVIIFSMTMSYFKTTSDALDFDMYRTMMISDDFGLPREWMFGPFFADFMSSDDFIDIDNDDY